MNDGPASRYFAPMLRDATKAVEEAKEEAGKFSTVGPPAPPFLTADEEDLVNAWESADLPVKRDLLRLAIEAE